MTNKNCFPLAFVRRLPTLCFIYAFWLVTGVHSQTLDSSFNPGANGNPAAMVAQPDGKFVVGGYFQTLAGQARANIGRLSSDGTLDVAFNPGADGPVNCLAIQTDGKILVGGAFANLAYQSHNNIGRLNADGSIDAEFSPATDGRIWGMALQADGRIVIVGDFISVSGWARNHIARLDPDGTVDASFDPGALSYTGAGTVYGIAMQSDGKILVAGLFTEVANQACTNLARLNADGTLDTTFRSPILAGKSGSQLGAVAVDANGKIVVTGFWIRIAGLSSDVYVARFNSDGSLDSTFNCVANSMPYSIGIQADSKLLMVGGFTGLGGQRCIYNGRINASGSADVSFNATATQANGIVSALLLQPDGKFLMGGGFSGIYGQARAHIARINNIPSPATETLAYAGTRILWQRGGICPEFWRTSYEATTNGTDWVSIGDGTRVSGGWQSPEFALLTKTTFRARGFVACGNYNGSSWFQERTFESAPPPKPKIVTGDGSFGFKGNQFGFNIAGSSGQMVTVEGSNDLVSWTPLTSYTLTSDSASFIDPSSGAFHVRFYRLRFLP